ncbi:hypothetical protein Tco_0128673 [Tanacetum coccineum]
MSRRVESPGDEEDLGEDASKHGRRINAIDADEDITLVSVQDDADVERKCLMCGVTLTVMRCLQNKKFLLKDKGKGKMVEPEPVKPTKKKVQIMLDEEITLNYSWDDKRIRISRAKEEKIDEANIDWDGI